VTALPKLRVKTRHSQYEIDQEAGTVLRSRVDERAADLSHLGFDDATPKQYRKLYLGNFPARPDSLVVVYADDTYTISTTIESVEELS
jgi:hypothetical protein